MDFEHDSFLVKLIITLLQHGVYVAIVTAAGYPRDPTRYEGRLSGLLKGFEKSGLDPAIFLRFFVLGIRNMPYLKQSLKRLTFRW
jgi:IMP and pyridine-specific 5'-nucleotidase